MYSDCNKQKLIFSQLSEAGRKKENNNAPPKLKSNATFS